MPHEGMLAIVGAFVAMRNRLAALATMVGFYCYLRPGEVCGLTAGELIAPLALSSAESLCWGLILGTSALGQPGKVSEYDDSVFLDVPHMAWSDPYLRKLSRLQPATANVWPFTTAESCKRFVAAANASGVGVLGL